ncbi:MAG: hypothetical protein Fur005_35060 [Roseiflexaceae bacterium]
MRQSIGLFIRAAIIWIVPLVVSFGFYDRQGELTSSYAWFKSVMVLILSITTFAVGVIRPPRGQHPVLVAGIYLLINLLLDLVVLVPLMGISLAQYLEQIALVYSIIPLLTYALLRQPQPSFSPTPGRVSPSQG